MSATMTQAESAKSFSSDEARWQAVVQRDKNADGKFVYSVKTTRVYCRPSCAAKLPRKENVRFHLTPTDAEKAGFRACKRCHPRHFASDNYYADVVAKACKLIMEADTPPSLDTLAGAAGMSPSHFHRIFKSIAGLTPKAYVLAHRSRRVREELLQSNTVTSAIYNAGFNSNGRFYATSAKVLGMKPRNYRAGGKGTRIRFAVGECSLGSILVAASPVGICSVMLGDDPNTLVMDLQKQFPKAQLIGGDQKFEDLVAKVIGSVERPGIGLKLPLDVRGTAFQQRVWQKLCEIPCGETRTYSEVAEALGAPNATRAVARACAANSIAVAIPCHRVVRTDGSLSGYRWGVARKAKLLAREAKEH